MTALFLHTQWMKTLSGASRIPKQDLRNVSKADGARGGREKPEGRRLGMGGNSAPKFIQEDRVSPPLPMSLIYSSVHMPVHTQT